MNILCWVSKQEIMFLFIALTGIVLSTLMPSKCNKYDYEIHIFITILLSLLFWYTPNSFGGTIFFLIKIIFANVCIHIWNFRKCRTIISLRHGFVSAVFDEWIDLSFIKFEYNSQNLTQLFRSFIYARSFLFLTFLLTHPVLEHPNSSS